MANRKPQLILTRRIKPTLELTRRKTFDMPVGGVDPAIIAKSNTKNRFSRKDSRKEYV